ncbi:hypothetical protein [Sphingomonas lenta]|uniref:Uncharacterized protein n=1 Tax=Sphingomonas lenta TaxID=1141887 RepID=A0A2A2SIJ5_9SPHN|nr:hypothetical protein [Sphingomonas lenta]PAX09062.1 hypothetical protein CKY28_06975 [Sphingomonas lenta]
MDYSLLDIEDYDGPPNEPHRKFAALEQKARRNMNEIMENTQSGDLSTELRSQYMMLMTSAARALGVPGLELPDESEYRNEWEAYQAFSIRIRGLVAEIMLNDTLVAKPHSVRLSTSTKSKIESQIIVLRGMIEDSDMEPKRRKRLIEQLDDFSAELNRPRLNYAVAMSAMALFLSGIQGTTSTLADAPNAYQTVGTILKWIGADKEAEERERERLTAPAPALPAPKPKPKLQPKAPQQSPGDFGDDFDDDVPF